MRNIDKIQYIKVSDAVRYLTSMGWKISEKSFYRHIQQGKLSEKPWQKEILDAYAAEFLHPSVKTSTTGAMVTKGAARELIEARKAKIGIETELKNFELAQKQGDYMLVSEHSRVMCAKLYLIRDTVFNWIRENAADLIRSCNGDRVRDSEIIGTYQKSFENYWNRLDTDKEWPILPDSDWSEEPILK